MISIVIATYNRAKELPKALESCLAQTAKDFEVIVVDDGSMDATGHVVQDYMYRDSRVRYVRLEKNQGASVARNRGIQEAKGDWVMVWDSDDVLYPEALATLASHIQRHPQVVVVSAPTRMMRGENEIPHDILPEGFVTLEDVLCKRIGNNEKVRCARRDIYLKAPYVSRNIDFIVAARLRAQGEWLHLHSQLGDVFLSNADSLTLSRKKFSVQRSAERAVHLNAFLADFGDAVFCACPQKYMDIIYGASIANACAGMKKNARDYALSLISLRPFSPRTYIAFLFSIFFPGRRN